MCTSLLQINIFYILIQGLGGWHLPVLPNGPDTKTFINLSDSKKKTLFPCLANICPAQWIYYLESIDDPTKMDQLLRLWAWRSEMEHARSQCLRDGNKPSVSQPARGCNKLMSALHNISPVNPAWRHSSTTISCWGVTRESLFLLLQGSQLVVSYDEHEVNNIFKFGVIYQKFGQVNQFIDHLSV